MRVTHYEITRQVNGSRLAVYTVEIARRQLIVTRALGSARVRIQRPLNSTGGPRQRGAA
jgi:hypothetical protein